MQISHVIAWQGRNSKEVTQGFLPGCRLGVSACFSPASTHGPLVDRGLSRTSLGGRPSHWIESWRTPLCLLLVVLSFHLLAAFSFQLATKVSSSTSYLTRPFLSTFLTCACTRAHTHTLSLFLCCARSHTHTHTHTTERGHDKYGRREV